MVEGTHKLLPRRVGPFKVIGVTASKAACKLELPKGWKVHNVFHVSLLERYY
jgi:hypothetical protein